MTKNITPTVLVGLYGWDTKDFVVGPHERSFDDNKDGKIDSNDQRNLEAEVGAETQSAHQDHHSAKGGEWEVEADLTTWADLIKDGTVKRRRGRRAADGRERRWRRGRRQRRRPGRSTWAPSSTTRPSRRSSTIDKCENCHAALATTFHEPSYGGSVTACRMCHITKSGGSHLEMQSRSLDSYVHAIHSIQALRRGEHRLQGPGPGPEVRGAHRPCRTRRTAIDQLRVLPRRGHVRRAGPGRVAAGDPVGLGRERDLGSQDRHRAVRCDRPGDDAPAAAATARR